jgi:hypothetical protein
MLTAMPMGALSGLRLHQTKVPRSSQRSPPRSPRFKRKANTMDSKPEVRPPRQTITLLFRGTAPLELPPVVMNGKKVKATIKPGDNTLPIAYFHAIGGDPAFNAFLADGTIAAVCREHEHTQEELNVFGQATGRRFCRYCGNQLDPPADDLLVRHLPAPEKAAALEGPTTASER